MRVLIGCEESQTVCQAFRARGHEAFSCDLLHTRGNPDWHIQGGIADHLLNVPDKYYDLIILHPDCTAMAVSGNRWYGKGMKYHDIRIQSVQWTGVLWLLAINKGRRVCLENPVSVVFPALKEEKPELVMQYIQPWQFGHGETKKTGLALHRLPELKPTDIVEGREQRVWKMAPSPTRKRDRSKTYQGIANAMADQWGNL